MVYLRIKQRIYFKSLIFLILNFVKSKYPTPPFIIYNLVFVKTKVDPINTAMCWSIFRICFEHGNRYITQLSPKTKVHCNFKYWIYLGIWIKNQGYFRYKNVRYFMFDILSIYVENS